MALAFYQILKNGGLGNGGFNFDARCAASRSIRPTCCMAISAASTSWRVVSKGAAALITDGTFDKALEERYAG